MVNGVYRDRPAMADVLAAEKQRLDRLEHDARTQDYEQAHRVLVRQWIVALTHPNPQGTAFSEATRTYLRHLSHNPKRQ